MLSTQNSCADGVRRMLCDRCNKAAAVVFCPDCSQHFCRENECDSYAHSHGPSQRHRRSSLRVSKLAVVYNPATGTDELVANPAAAPTGTAPTENIAAGCWHYSNRHGIQQGPVTIEELKSAWDEGNLLENGKFFVSNGDMQDWMRVTDHPDMLAFLSGRSTEEKNIVNAKCWLYADASDVRQGPMTVEDLKGAWDAGLFDENSKFFTQSGEMESWMRVADHPDMLAFLSGISVEERAAEKARKEKAEAEVPHSVCIFAQKQVSAGTSVDANVQALVEDVKFQKVGLSAPFQETEQKLLENASQESPQPEQEQQPELERRETQDDFADGKARALFISEIEAPRTAGNAEVELEVDADRCWYYSDMSGKQKGPVTIKELKHAWRQKFFNADSLCFDACGDTTEWLRVGDHTDLLRLLNEVAETFATAAEVEVKEVEESAVSEKGTEKRTRSNQNTKSEPGKNSNSSSSLHKVQPPSKAKSGQPFRRRYSNPAAAAVQASNKSSIVSAPTSPASKQTTQDVKKQFSATVYKPPIPMLPELRKLLGKELCSQLRPHIQQKLSHKLKDKFGSNFCSQTAQNRVTQPSAPVSTNSKVKVPRNLPLHKETGNTTTKFKTGVLPTPPSQKNARLPTVHKGRKNRAQGKLKSKQIVSDVVLLDSTKVFGGFGVKKQKQMKQMINKVEKQISEMEMKVKPRSLSVAVKPQLLERYWREAYTTAKLSAIARDHMRQPGQMKTDDSQAEQQFSTPRPDTSPRSFSTPCPETSPRSFRSSGFNNSGTEDEDCATENNSLDSISQNETEFYDSETCTDSESDSTKSDWGPGAQLYGLPPAMYHDNGYHFYGANTTNVPPVAYYPHSHPYYPYSFVPQPKY